MLYLHFKGNSTVFTKSPQEQTAWDVEKTVCTVGRANQNDSQGCEILCPLQQRLSSSDLGLL